MGKMFLHLVVIYVEYDREKYKDSFEILKSYLDKIRFCKKTYFIIDNLNEGNYIKIVGDNIYRIGGDNSDREFSGWQKGLDTLYSKNIPYHLILFVNEAFMVPGRSYLEDYASIFLLLKSLIFNMVIGRIDSHQETLHVLGYNIDEWICTNCFFVPKKVINNINNIVTIDSVKINDFLDEKCHIALPKETLLTKKITNDILIDNRFVIEVDIDKTGQFVLEIELDKSFIPKYCELNNDSRELGIIINKIELMGEPLDNNALLSGWYPIEGTSRWINKTAKLTINKCSHGKLILEGFIPDNIFEKIYNREIELKISVVNDFFKDTAPISRNYKELINEWLTQRWHSKFQINENTWYLFRVKASAILNEALLTARIKEKGFKIRNYGGKKYY